MKFKLSLVVLLAGVVVINLASCKSKGTSSTDTQTVTPIGKGMYSDSASSSVRVFDQNGKVCVQQSNTSYEVINAYEGKNKVPLLLKITRTELCVADSVNKEKVYEITAKSILDTKSIGWNAKFVATNIEFKDNTLIATSEGGDNEEDYIKMFALLNGKEVFSCSYGPLKVTIPNVKEKRFIGFTSRKASSNPIAAMNEENLIGVIHYGSSSAAIDGFKVKLKRTKISPKIPNTTPDMILVAANTNTTVIEDGKTIILMKADEHYTTDDVKDFAVKFTIYYGDDNESTDIIIPIVKDKLDLSGAKYDKELFELTPLQSGL